MDPAISLTNCGFSGIQDWYIEKKLRTPSLNLCLIISLPLLGSGVG
jgi:hypothetical protein